MAALPALATNDSERFFLGVEKSATGRSWRDRLDERGQARALTIAQRSGVPELLARVLAGRGVEPDEVAAYLDPSIKTLLPDPHVLTDMAAASARLAHAVIHGESVAIFGDYDVDGATAAALLARYLRALRARSDRAYSRPHLRGLWAQRRRHPLVCRARRQAFGHRRLRDHQP